MKIKRFVCVIMVLFMLGSVCSIAVTHPFDDVPTGSWYERDVEYVYRKSLMSGTAASTFAPNVTMTRAMLVTVLYRLEGEPAVTKMSPFSDVKDSAYYAKAVAWAYENEVVNGISKTLFAPNNYVSREQMVTIFARYATYLGLETLATNDLTDYGDWQKIASYALNAFRWGVGAGIINGTSADSLSPQGTATRAQCAAILHRFIDWKWENTEVEEEDWETEEA